MTLWGSAILLKTPLFTPLEVRVSPSSTGSQRITQGPPSPAQVYRGLKTGGGRAVVSNGGGKQEATCHVLLHALVQGPPLTQPELLHS